MAEDLAVWIDGPAQRYVRVTKARQVQLAPPEFPESDYVALEECGLSFRNRVKQKERKPKVHQIRLPNVFQ